MPVLYRFISRAGGEYELRVGVEAEAVDLGCVGLHRVGGLVAGRGPGGGRLYRSVGMKEKPSLTFDI